MTTQSDWIEQAARAYVAIGDVPRMEDAAIRAAMRAAITRGRVGARRTDVADVARILIEHGLFSVSTGAYGRIADALAALPDASGLALIEQDAAQWRAWWLVNGERVTAVARAEAAAYLAGRSGV